MLADAHISSLGYLWLYESILILLVEVFERGGKSVISVC